MSDVATDERIKAEVWAEHADTGEDMHIEFERTDTDEVALHTFHEERGGSLVSVYFSREGAIAAARDLLEAARLR